MVDVLVFNPPYVVTDSAELERAIRDRDIYASWAGGENGTQVILEFIEQLPCVLAEHGCVYLLMLENNRPRSIAAKLEEKGFASTCLVAQTTGIEKLSVWRFDRRST